MAVTCAKKSRRLSQYLQGRGDAGSDAADRGPGGQQRAELRRQARARREHRDRDDAGADAARGRGDLVEKNQETKSIPNPVWIVALIITVVQPSARTCAALSFAPTSTMPDRKMVDVANLSPGAIASRTAAGAALAAAAPRTMLAGTELTCQSAGRLLATTAPPPAVHAAAARPVADDVRATRRRRDSSTRRRNLSTRLVNVVAAASPRPPEASVVDAGGGRVRVWLAGRAC